MDKLLSLIESRRFWAAIASIIATLFKDSLPITPEQLQQVVMLVAAWILGDSLKSTTRKPNGKSNGGLFEKS